MTLIETQHPKQQEGKKSEKFHTLVLPFTHLDGSKPIDTFSQELYAQLALAISYNNKIEVINHGLSIDDISNISTESLATEFAATHILTGRIDQREDKVFITVALKNKDTKQTIWSQNISTEFTDKIITQKILFRIYQIHWLLLPTVMTKKYR
ncbi:MAG: hypothetical protein R3E90_09835 [Marinicella sp.]